MSLHALTTKRFLIAVSAVTLMAAGLALAPGASAQTVDPPGAVINNGTVQLGVHDTANLNFSCTSETDPGCPGPGSSLSGTSAVGLRFMQYNADGTAPGCLCEGWGAADAGGSGLSGFANVSGGTSSNLTVDSFTATATSAVSVMTISHPTNPDYRMQVTHDYHPATGTPNLYEVLVTIENTGTEPLTDVRYRRVMGWDVEPTAFEEWVTIQGTSGAENLLFDSDDGFASANPLSGRSYIDSEAVCGPSYTGACDFVDLGSGGTHPGTSPSDHGALFDFQFGSLGVGDELSFRTYYGAAGSETEALGALGSQSVEIYSLGESNCPVESPDGGDATPCADLESNAGVEQGEPITFMFAFSGVGGDPVLPGPLVPSKEAADGTSQPGAQNSYTITIDNPNDEAVDADSISDTLPSGFSYVPDSTSGASTANPSQSGSTLTWTGPFSVPAEGNITLSFDVTVSNTPGEYDNQASVEFGEDESSSTGPTATIVVEEPGNITKTADDSTSQGGEENGYTITITNPTQESGEGEGESLILDIVQYDSITDELPDGFTYVPGSTSGLTDADPDIDEQTLTWDGPFFIPSESQRSLHFNVTVSDTPGDYDNEAAANQIEGESLSTGPTATITVEEPASIEKEADSPTSEAGTQNGYTIFITNPTEESEILALDTVTYDFITDTLPSGFSYVAGSTTGLTDADPDIVGQTLTWDGPFDIASETTETLHFDVVVSGTPGQYFNVASVTEGESELSTGDTAPIDVTAAPVPPLPPPPPGPVSLPCDPITAEGGPGGDRLFGGIGPDRIRALGGRDIVDTGAGNDEICGGEGGDFLYGRADSDTIRGEGGNDRLYGGLHADTLYGDAGHDALIGGKGADTFFTQDGVKDCIMTGKGADTVTGDVGLDLVDPRGGCPPGFWL